MATRQPPPLRAEFDTDPRVEFNTTTGKYEYEDEAGTSFEWIEGLEGKGVWLPMLTEEQIKAQQAAYSVAGVDEEAPVAPPAKKRKNPETDHTSNSPTASTSATTSSQPNQRPAKAPKQRAPRPITDVYVTNLPPTATVDLLASVFGRAGVLMTNDDGGPKIKLYLDDNGRFKGEALVSYFKEGSVDLAIRLFDDTELELGSGMGNMRVSRAEYSGPSKVELKLKQKAQEEAAAASNGAGGEHESGADNVVVGEGKKKKRPKIKDEDQKKAAKRYWALQSKLESWDSDSDNESPLAPAGGPPPPGNSRLARVVVLRHMFSPKELEEDPGLSLELKEDVREEAESIGVVTNVVLFDKEEDGIMTIKFKDAISAQACILKMNGRFFGGRRIEATTYTGKERFRRSDAKDEYLDPEEREAEEKKRLDSFAAWLVDGPGENGEEVEA